MMLELSKLQTFFFGAQGWTKVDYDVIRDILSKFSFYQK